MDLYRYLKKEHKKISFLFEQIISSHNSRNIADTFAELEALLSIHADAEQASFYKKLLEVDHTKSLSQHATKEHKEVKKYLNKMNKLNKKDKKWLVYLGELKHAVQKHVSEEETLLFEEAKKIISKEESSIIAEQIQQYIQNHLEEEG